jgi:enterochelin esterase-like enzyme
MFMLRLLSCLAVSSMAMLTARTSPQAKPGCTATGDLDISPFESKVFPGARNLRVLIPDGYALPENRNRRYPVLYLNDGQNLFDVCTSLFNREEWRVDETVRNLVAKGGLRPLIVVGIDNGGKRLRPREYLPYVDDTLRPAEPDPQGKLYPTFLLDEVVPTIEKRYRVLAGSQNRVLGGSSYGAGAALYAVIRRPGSFGGLLLESPSIYASDYQLLKDAEAVHNWPQRIFIGTGTVREPVDDVARLKEFFRKNGLGDDRLRIVVQEGGTHSERWWAERLPQALQFLFPVERKDR